MPVGRDGWFEHSERIRVEGGIRAKTARGTIGSRWWSRRFIDILERICDKGRLGRGRSYARSGQVLELTITPGLVEARVQGSRPDPYDVAVRIDAYGPAQWDALTAALAARAVYRAKLLAGDMPEEIEEVFGECRLPLFPGESGLDMECSCPDWGFPCKHLSAVLYLLAEAFDGDPFLVLAWRGMAKDDLLSRLRTTPADDETPETWQASPLDVEDAPLTARVADFYSPGASLARLRERHPAPAAPPDLLLRALDPPPIKARHIPILDLLRPAYRRLSESSDSRSPADDA